MTPQQRKELDELAYDNPQLHTLLQILDYGNVPSEIDWWHLAVKTLATTSTYYFHAAVDAEMRAPPRPLKLGEVP